MKDFSFAGCIFAYLLIIILPGTIALLFFTGSNCVHYGAFTPDEEKARSHATATAATAVAPTIRAVQKDAQGKLSLVTAQVSVQPPLADGSTALWFPCEISITNTDTSAHYIGISIELEVSYYGNYPSDPKTVEISLMIPAQQTHLVKGWTGLQYQNESWTYNNEKRWIVRVFGQPSYKPYYLKEGVWLEVSSVRMNRIVLTLSDSEYQAIPASAVVRKTLGSAACIYPAR